MYGCAGNQIDSCLGNEWFITGGKEKSAQASCVGIHCIEYITTHHIYCILYFVHQNLKNSLALLSPFFHSYYKN